MTFEQIGYFLALADEKSFVRAARRCGISQPSLTKAIKSLEATLGAPLFERGAKGSELTLLGRKIRPLLARLHADKRRTLDFAHKFDWRSVEHAAGMLFATKSVRHDVVKGRRR